jgi:AcrR family transcriptional regulator
VPRKRPAVSNSERRETTRRAVLDAAAECFDQRGYLATRLDDVTERAKLTKGAVYFHFGSKEALAAALIDEQFSYWPGLIEELTGRPGTSLDHLVHLTYEMSRSLRDNVAVRAGFRLALDQDVPSVEPAENLAWWTSLATDLLRKARRDDSLTKKVSPAAAGRVVVAGVIGCYHLATVIDGKPDARKRLDEFWAIVLPQLSPAG